MRDIDDFKFTGPFSKEIPLYVQYKRSCGYKVAETDLYRLREMDRLFKEMGISEPVITREMYEVWTAVKPGERKVTSSRKRSILSSFGKWNAQAVSIVCIDRLTFLYLRIDLSCQQLDCHMERKIAGT